MVLLLNKKISMDSKKIFKLLAPMYLLIHVVHSTSLNEERWTHPCRGSTNGLSSIWVLDLLRHGDSDQVVAHKLWLEANDIITIATTLRDHYSQQRIQSGDLQTYLDQNVTIVGFPDVRILNPNTNLIERLHEDFRRASIVAVFIQQIRMDEQASNLSPNYVRLLQMLESQLYPFLCQLKIAITDRSSIPVSNVSRNVMVESDRNLSNTAMRYCRDYRILKDTVELLTSIQRDYDVIRQVDVRSADVQTVEKKSVKS